MSESKRPKLTTIGRAIDLRTPTNLAVVILTLVTFLGGLLVTSLFRGEALATSALTSLAWAGSVFLSWALARELDPDRWFSAFFAVAGALVAASLFAPPVLLTMFWFLIAMRIINRSTGLPPGVIDVVGFCTISAWLGWTTHWVFLFLALPALLLTGVRLRPARTQFLITLVIAAGGIALGIVRSWTLTSLDPTEHLLEMNVVVAITLACTLVIRSYRNATSVADRTGEPLDPQRIQWALAWGLSAGIVLTFGTGASLQEISPLWAALAGTALGWGFEQLRAVARRRSSR